MAQTRDALLNPEGSKLPQRDTGGEVFFLHTSSSSDPKVLKFKKILASWINSYLREDKAYVRDIVEDLHDGQLLLSFVEKLTGESTGHVVGVMSEKSKLGNVNATIRYLYNKHGIVFEEGVAEGVVKKDFISIAKILVRLAHDFKCPQQLPSHIEVVVVHRDKISGGGLSSKTARYKVTEDESLYGVLETQTADASPNSDIIIEDDPNERDAFDDLFEPGAEAKLETVKKLLLTFANKHLSTMGIQVSNIANQFHDGVYLVMLIGSLGNFFVPLYNYHLAPTTTEMKIHNIIFAFKLMDTLEVKRRRCRPEAIVQQDLKTTLRILYNLFTAFKNAPV